MRINQSINLAASLTRTVLLPCPRPDRRHAEPNSRLLSFILTDNNIRDNTERKNLADGFSDLSTAYVTADKFVLFLE